jgi:hypothetical protein
MHFLTNELKEFYTILISLIKMSEIGWYAKQPDYCDLF